MIMCRQPQQTGLQMIGNLIYRQTSMAGVRCWVVEAKVECIAEGMGKQLMDQVFVSQIDLGRTPWEEDEESHNEWMMMKKKNMLGDRDGEIWQIEYFKMLFEAFQVRSKLN